MQKPELIVVAGCNAAGKSSFIRTRISELQGFEMVMTDVYKGRSKEVFRGFLSDHKSIILETVFNDSFFKDLVDEAKNADYNTSLVVLFLDSISHSIERVAFRNVEQNGLAISDGNVKINFNESFKNIAYYYFYFDKVEFIYTGVTDKNLPIMSFNKSQLKKYRATTLNYPQKFAEYAYNYDRLNEESYSIITKNLDYNER
jgi:predicted ABC-type ATPase